MNKEARVVKIIKKSPGKYRASGSRKRVGRRKKRDLLKDVFGFRWFKKAMVGKTQEESLDLLDQWILKKRALSLFF